MEEARKRSMEITAYTLKYNDVLDELREKAPSLLKRAANGSKAASIRVYCYLCVGGYYPSRISECDTRECPMWAFRMGKGKQHPGNLDLPEGHILHEVREKLPGLWKRVYKKQIRSGAIRMKCHDCTCNTGYNAIQECRVYDCPSWRYRRGKGRDNPEEKERLERLVKKIDYSAL